MSAASAHGRAGESGLPGWLSPLARAAGQVTPEQLSRFLPPVEGGRPGAVLVLFGEDAHGPDVLLLQRAADMRSHPGQPAFPGGAVDPGDAGPVAAALREAQEETGLDPAGVEVFATLPALWLPPSGFVVTPVLGWWREPSPVHPAIPAEVAAVHRVPVAELVDPDNRVRVTHPSGYVGPAFQVRGMLVWGFTGGLLDRILSIAGLAMPWRTDRFVPLPDLPLREDDGTGP
jgi:8-oxo-dGTP pyrophosphatase MutT (NUDIX family)